MSNRMGWLAALSFAAVGAYIGCGGGGGGADDGDNGDESGTPDGDQSVGGGDLEIVFKNAYSGFDGVHDYKIPVKVIGHKNATFTASPANLVSIAKEADGAMITTKGAGKVTITATVGDLKGTATLNITQYTPEQWTAGDNRYNNGEPFKMPEFDPCNPPTTLPTISAKLACTTCHGLTGTLADVEHTPTQTGGYSDEDLINIFTKATKPEGVGQNTSLPAFVWKYFHKWEVTDLERTGVIAKLRSLAPRESNPNKDFGGRLRGDAGISIPRCDGGTPTIPPGLLDGGVGGN